MPELKGYVSFPKVAEQLDVSRQRVFQMLDERKLKTARRLPGTGDRPAAYMITEAERDRLVAEQKAAREAAERPDGEMAAAS